MPSWSRIATRTRVPLGFLFAAAYFWFARPAWWSIGAGLALILAGLLVRAVASGHIRKNAALTTTGPYAYTRNPLYLGSILIAAGFGLASRNIWIAASAVLMFLLIYMPVIKAEEKYLRSIFPDYGQYAARVPRLLPRLSPSRAHGEENNTGQQFSMDLYMRHREYQAAIGSVAMLAALILRMVWQR